MSAAALRLSKASLRSADAFSSRVSNTSLPTTMGGKLGPAMSLCHDTTLKKAGSLFCRFNDTTPILPFQSANNILKDLPGSDFVYQIRSVPDCQSIFAQSSRAFLVPSDHGSEDGHFLAHGHG